MGLDGETVNLNEVIGLPAITAEKLYMIAVSTVNRRGSLRGVDIRLGGENVLHCTYIHGWDVEFF